MLGIADPGTWLAALREQSVVLTVGRHLGWLPGTHVAKSALNVARMLRGQPRPAAARPAPPPRAAAAAAKRASASVTLDGLVSNRTSLLTPPTALAAMLEGGALDDLPPPPAELLAGVEEGEGEGEVYEVAKEEVAAPDYGAAVWVPEPEPVRETQNPQEAQEPPSPLYAAPDEIVSDDDDDDDIYDNMDVGGGQLRAPLPPRGPPARGRPQGHSRVG